MMHRTSSWRCARTTAHVIALVAVLGGCSASDGRGGAAASDPDDSAGADATPHGDPENGYVLGPESQREGDPERGLAIILAGAYVGCGIPASLAPIAQQAGLFGDYPPLEGKDDGLPYFVSKYRVASGVEVVGPNCLTCHAGMVNGELVIGAPATDLDYGGFASQIEALGGQVAQLEGVLAEADFRELKRFADRMGAIAPYVQPEVAGVSPADNLAAILFAHRHQETMAWSETPLLEPPPTHVVPVDVPAWWRMKKKTSMFHTAAGRGDHARIMMAASVLCVDDVAEARRIDDDFHHVRAFIDSLPAPRWTHGVNGTLVVEGEQVFTEACARCHGSYGEGEDYPNRWLPVETVGTDPILAIGASQFAERFVAWFNGSFFGETAYLEPRPGYVAPPLDGVRASAPYFHNGSVPTLAQVLESSTRPTYWRRPNYDSTDYDTTGVGLVHEVLDFGHADIANAPARRRIYDTTLTGYGNQGHPFGDVLSERERAAVIEYLKTL